MGWLKYLIVSILWLVFSQYQITSSASPENISPCQGNGKIINSCYHVASMTMAEVRGRAYCRSKGGFLPTPEQFKLMNLNSWEVSTSWSSLRLVSNRINALSRYPTTRETSFWSISSRINSSQCLAWNFSKNQIDSFDCGQMMGIFCIMDSFSLKEEEFDNYKLVVEANFKMEGDWIETNKTQIDHLYLKCSIIDKNSGEAKKDVPIFWSKDGKFIDHNTAFIQPSTVFDPSGYAVGSASTELLGGSFACHLWKKKLDELVDSNRVLVTLEEWGTLVITARFDAVFFDHLFYEMDSWEIILSIIEKVKYSLVKEFSWLDAMPKSFLENSRLVINESIVYQYTFYILYPSKNSTKFEQSIPYLNQLFRKNEFLCNSSLSLLTSCIERNDPLPNLNNIYWPFARAGHIYSDNDFRCEVKDNRLAKAWCQWDTMGAYIKRNSDCVRLDFCPKGFVGIANRFCVKVVKDAQWEAAFQWTMPTEVKVEEFLTGDFFQTKLSFYKALKNFLLRNGDKVIWLPVKRLVETGPLFDFSKGKVFHQGVYEWTKLHPNPEEMCLTLNIESDKLATTKCSSKISAVIIIDYHKLKELVSKKDSMPLVTPNSEICSGWDLAKLTPGRPPCLKVLKEKTTSWAEASQLCQKEKSHLFFPGRGFDDWVLRQILDKKGVGTAWINLRQDEIAERSFDFLNWLPETAYSKQFGIATPKGWRLTNQTKKTHNVICERKAQTSTFLIALSKLNSYDNEICIAIDSQILLLTKESNLSLKCFFNGNHESVLPSHHKNCSFNLPISGQGVYQCYALKMNPVQLIFSNSYLHRKLNTFTYVLYANEDNVIYDPRMYDATYFNSMTHFPANTCLKTLKNYASSANFKKAALSYKADTRVTNYFFSNNRVSFHIEITPKSLKRVKNNKEYYTESEEIQEKMKKYFNQNLHINSKCKAIEVRSTIGCPSETTTDSMNSNATVTWSRTTVPGHFPPSELCLGGKGQLVLRKCDGNFLKGYRWGKFDGCSKTKQATRTLALWSIAADPQAYVDGELNTLQNITRIKSSELLAADYQLSTKIFQKFSENKTLCAKLSFDDVTGTINNLMGMEETNLDVATSLTNQRHLLKSYEKIVFDINEQKEKFSEKERIIARCVKADKNVIGFKIDTLSKSYLLYDIKKEDDIDAAIVLPELNSKPNLENEYFFAVYKTPVLFHDPSIRTKNLTVGSHVISAKLKGKEVMNLTKYVQIFLRANKQSVEHICVFWDFYKNEGRGGWSEEGCHLKRQNGSLVLCECNHLTNFALLLRPLHGSVSYSKEDLMALEIISKLGCSLSLLGMTTVLCTFLLCPRMRSRLDNKILANLSASIMCSMVIFLFGIDQTEDVVACRTISALLHYFILASFGWTMVEAILYYLKYAKLSGKYIPNLFYKRSKGNTFLWKAFVCAWGLPLLPVIILAVYDYELYDYDAENSLCWMSNTAFLYAFAVPLGLVFIFNLIIYVIIIKSTFFGHVRLASNQKENNLRKLLVSMAVWVFFLLGFTWIFGILFLMYPSKMFSYLFCIFSTLQGFFIFLSYVSRDQTTRQEFKKSFKSFRSDKSFSSSKSQTNHKSFKRTVRKKLSKISLTSKTLSTEI